MITVTMHKDGTASFALPRVETGQGITTSSAMLIAEELGIPVSRVHVTLADARPELMMNQFTAGSNTTISTYTPIRSAAAAAKQQMLLAAARELGVDVSDLSTDQGVVRAPDGRTMTYGDLAEKAAVTETREIEVQLAQLTMSVRSSNNNCFHKSYDWRSQAAASPVGYAAAPKDSHAWAAARCAAGFSES